jgi:hypothetical protein
MTIAEVCNKFLAFYNIRKLITMFTRARHLSVLSVSLTISSLKLYILPTECAVVFHMVLTINSQFFPKQH